MRMIDFFNTPETAITTFETWSGLQIFIWDLDETALTPYVLPARTQETYPHCITVQSRGLHHKCVAFEQHFVYGEIGNHPEGLTKVCHAGLLEWAVPIILEGRIIAILYAGQGLVGHNLRITLSDSQSGSTDLSWAATHPPLKLIDTAKSALYLEGLRQLAARLQLWLIEAQRIVGQSPHISPKSDWMTRRNVILNFIHQHHTERITMADLATLLHLSQSRTAHVVKEVCGQTFSNLVVAARIRSATTLLRYSQLSVSDIAYQCGFTDPSRFYKLFKQSMGMTPVTFRQQRWHEGRVGYEAEEGTNEE